MMSPGRDRVWLSRILIRIYPADWRVRHGEELAAILEQRPPDPGDILDLLRGAFDAHVHGPATHERLEGRVHRSSRARGRRAAVPALLAIMALGLNLAMAFSIVAALGSDPDGWQGWGVVALIATSLAGAAWLGRRVRAPRVAR